MMNVNVTRSLIACVPPTLHMGNLPELLASLMANTNTSHATRNICKLFSGRYLNSISLRGPKA